MLSHILSNYYRHFLRSRFQVITIVSGLSLAITVAVLIFLYVREERGFDKHHTDAHRLYRIDTILEMEGKVDRTAKAGLNTGESLMEFYPEIESHTQFLNVQKQTIRVGAELFASDKVVYADSNALTFFTYDFISGNPSEALIGPNKVVVSDQVAQQLFGSVDAAMGNDIEVNKNKYTITGIYKAGGHPTHIPYNVFLSLSSLPKGFLDQRNREYMWLTTFNYVKLKEGVSLQEFQAGLGRFNTKFLVPYVDRNEVNGAITFELEPVSGIHLNNTLRFDMSGATNPAHLKIFSVVAILTLFIALVNYVNLTTARVSKRVREIGIKKAVGASRTSLFLQFMLETLLTVYISFLISMGLLYFALPELNKLTEQTFTFRDLLTMEFLLRAHAFVLIFGLLASVYPSLLLSSFKSIHAIRDARRPVGVSWHERLLNPSSVRKVLVTLQFSISIFLIIGTLVIFKQFRHMHNMDLGFNQDQVMVIDIPSDTSVSNHLDVVRNQLLGMPAVKSVSSTSSIPGGDHGALTMNMSQSGGSEIKVINTYIVDDKFAETLGLELAQGRFFSREFSTDPQEAFVINEAAVRFLGWNDNPIGKMVESPLGQRGVVVGVLKDFNYKSLHASIEPLILMNTLNSTGYLMVKISTSTLDNTIANIGDLWKEFDPGHPYEYFFLDAQFEKQYIREQRLMRIFTYFAVLAIVISCLGLIGLAVFTNEIRTREIGIRKALGASDMEIVRLLSGGFLMLILLANLIAWPSSYFLIEDWINEFAYKANIGLFPFLMGGLAALLIVGATVGYFAFKASRGDVVEALKYE